MTPPPPRVSVARTRPDWDPYFIGIAEAVAARGDCRRAQVGAVIVKDHRVVSTGYNGAPAGGLSCLAGECPRGLISYEDVPPLSGDYSNCIALHAEANAVAYADRAHTAGGAIYITYAPCDMCTKLCRAAGIRRAVWPDPATPDALASLDLST